MIKFRTNFKIQEENDRMPLLDRMGEEKPTSSSFKGGQEEKEPWEQGRGKMPDHFTFL